ncbi:MAG: hypothetical protein ACP5H2_06195 [Solirubrobacteraceae bacterium]
MIKTRPRRRCVSGWPWIYGPQCASVHLQEQLPGCASDAPLCGGRAIKPQTRLQPADLVEIARRLSLIDRLDQLFGGSPRLLVRRATHAAADQHQPSYALWVSQRKIDCYSTAH